MMKARPVSDGPESAVHDEEWAGIGAEAVRLRLKKDEDCTMQSEFMKQLRESKNVHVPLKWDESLTVEAEMLKKKVVGDALLWDGKDMTPWTFDGEGEAEVADGVLVMKTGSRADHWPAEEVRSLSAQDGRYATFGSYIARLHVKGMQLDGNRIRFRVRPMCDGLHSPIIRVGFTNNGTIKIPDAYSREGFNAINLRNHEWNTCIWEIDSIAHDCIEEISFNVHRYGEELTSAPELRFELCDIHLEKIEDPNVVHGWQCRRETAVFSTTGYWPQGKKTAIANTQCAKFEIVREGSGEIAFSGDIQTVENDLGAFQVLDFSALTEEGSYCIRFGSYQSRPFAIAADIADSTLWKLTNFLFSERCGFPVPGKHGTCHCDVFARHNGMIKTFQGGWHDAADVSQQSTQSAEVMHAMLEAARAEKDRNPELYARLLEEANWGLDFILRCRFGDGYRMTHAGIRRWTDNLIGNMDDCDVDVACNSLDNFLCSGAEAFAGMMFAEEDRELSWKCIDAAAQDFDFAVERFEKVGVEVPVMQQHIANASRSQYLAAAVWAGAQLYEATKEERFARAAEDFARKLLKCQDTGDAGLPFSGFFYRDETKRSIVHFNHQSREHIFVQALCTACRALPQSGDKPAWEHALALYADYLKQLMQYTAPYGMVPAGVFSETELDDAQTFAVMHPTVDFEREKENYREQLEQGVSLGNGYYLRRFPVWFSYRGNSAVHMAMGKAASLLGNYFDDDELRDIAREQLYWTLGKNPFGESLIYGEGSRYGQQYTALLGETVGEIPVGVQTRRNEDLPYWPQANIATYREVWTTPVRCWMWIAADLI